MASSDKGKAKKGSTGQGAAERRRAIECRRVADRILHNNVHLPELLLDSLPYPAMLIQKDRTVLAANHIAKQLGAKVGEYCWQDFGQSEFIPEQDKQYINKHKEAPPGGTHCTFCKADEALQKQTHINNPEIKAWDKVWDTHWIPLGKETYLNYAIDVTHIVREDEKVRMSEIKHRTLAQNIPGLVYRVLVKQDNRILFFNDMLKPMTGFKESELTTDEVCSIEPHILSEDRDKVRDAVKHACEEKEPFEVEYRFECKNSDIKWFKEIGRPTFGPEGELLFIDGIITDITERKQVEEHLRSSEERYRALFESLAEPVTILDRDGIVLMVNAVGARNMGLSQEESIGKSIFEVLPGIDDSLHEVYRQVIDTGISVTREDFLEVPSGHRWFWSVHQPVSDINGTRYGVQIISYDITERKEAEEELRDESAFHEAVIERAAEGICVCHAVEEHPYVEFTVWNERMGEITGYTMDEINRLGWYQAVYPDPEVRERAIERMERMRQGDDLVAEEWEITRKDGLKRLMAISTSVITTEGDKSHVLALMHDITEEKKTQAERQSLLKSQ